jgi:predicted ArsR family transcriptional regulator
VFAGWYILSGCLSAALRHPYERRAEVANTLGLSTVHVNRALQDLRAEGLITFGRGRLTVGRRKGLTQIGEFDPNYLHLAPKAKELA